MARSRGLLKISALTPGPAGIHGGILSDVDTTIKIGAETRDKLAALAEARNMSMRALIEEFAATALTPAQLRERAERTDAFLAAEFGHRVSDDEAGALRERMRQAQNAGQARVRRSRPPTTTGSKPRSSTSIGRRSAAHRRQPYGGTISHSLDSARGFVCSPHPRG
ncbi:hypothetical protein STENM327S_03068 [Streptomyces tendae]